MTATSHLVSVYPEHKLLRTIQLDERRHALSRWIVLLAGLCLLTNLPARADGVSELSVTPSCLLPAPCKDDCRQLVNQAQDARQAGDHRAALRSLRSAFSIVPSCGILHSIANRHRDLGECEQAKRAIRAILQSMPATDEGARYAAVRKDELERLLSSCPDEQTTSAAPALQISGGTDTGSAKTDSLPQPVISPLRPSSAVLRPPTLEVKPEETGPQGTKQKAIPAYKRWWVWTSVGGIVLTGTAIGLGVGLTQNAEPMGSRSGASFPSDFRGGIYRSSPCNAASTYCNIHVSEWRTPSSYSAQPEPVE